MCEVTEWREGGASGWLCGGSSGRGASGLRFQAAVKVEVRTDDGGRVRELGLFIKQTTNVYATFITGRVSAPHAIYHVIEL